MFLNLIYHQNYIKNIYKINTTLVIFIPHKPCALKKPGQYSFLIAISLQTELNRTETVKSLSHLDLKPKHKSCCARELTSFWSRVGSTTETQCRLFTACPLSERPSNKSQKKKKRERKKKKKKKDHDTNREPSLNITIANQVLLVLPIYLYLSLSLSLSVSLSNFL